MECKHVMKCGKFKGEKCGTKAYHNGYCAKHKKAAVTSEVVEAVTGSAQAAETKARPKYKFSAFRFTVNSNTSGLNIKQEQIQEFKRLIGFIFDKDKVVEYLHDRTAADPSTNLAEVETSYFFEIATTNHTIHAHGVVKLKHQGNYILLIDVIRGVLDGVWGKKMHFNVQASGDADRSWTQYMEKNAAADKL